MQEQLVGLNQACEMLGVTDVTIRTWDKEGKLKAVKTPGGHRRWRLSDLQAFQGISQPETPDVEELIAIYGRVSSHDQKQKGDLDRQIGRLATHCNKKKYKVAHTLQDVGSGMSDSRPRLNQLFKLVETHAITKVVVEHKDRLTRFNFGVYERFFNSHGVVIECTEDKREKSYEQELVDDMISLMSSFSAKILRKEKCREPPQEERSEVGG